MNLARRACRCVLLLSLCASGSLFAIDAKAKWVRARTDYVEVLSDAAQKDAAEFAVQYSAFRMVLIEMLGEPARKLPPSTVVLFRQSRDFKRYFPSRDAKAQIVSVSSEVDGEALLGQVLDGDRAGALRMAFEFETTWALPRMGYYLPIWATQGTGKVFSTILLRRGVCVLGEFEMASIDGWARAPIPWARFFEISTGSPEYRDATQSFTYHSQAWALMHTLWLGSENGRERFLRLAAARRSSPDLRVVESVFGVAEKDLAKTLTRHVSAFGRPREFRFDEAGLCARMQTGAVPPAVVSVHMADLLLGYNRPAEAVLELNAARALSPDLPLIREAQARQELRGGDQGRALALYREAIQLGSRNVRAHLVSAEHRLNQMTSRGRDEAGGGGVFADEAVAELRRALELDPASDHAYRLLARAFFLRPEVDGKHVEELGRGIDLGDPSGAIRLYRVLLHQRLKQEDRYVEELQALSAAPGISENVREQTALRLMESKHNAVVARVQQLATDRRFKEAREALETYRKTAPAAPAVEKHLGQLERWLEQTESRAAR